ncbi:MAG: cation diffusion facilitator family transporter [Kosmotogaceae bacterium]
MSHSVNYNHNESMSKRIFFSIILNLLISIAELVGGFLSGSLALISDSLHNFADTSSLIISYFAQLISKKERTKKYTYGFKRIEIIATLINTTALLAVAIFLLKEAITKLLNPAAINSNLMISIAIVGLAGNLITVFLLRSGIKESLNIRSAFVHILSDTLSSVFVIAGGILISLYGWFIVDPLLTLVVISYIVYQSVHLLIESFSIIMQATPKEITVDDIKQTVEDLDFVDDVHHIHIWTTNGQDVLVECHVLIENFDQNKLDYFLSQIKKKLSGIGVDHTTIQIEQVCNTKDC